ncbi:hypothetical protein QN277_007366 [Acacia crassicarpa]|uniref:Uncharacterized protein n=1 Tax=Acacia crassicarpa TaxID=499986 RepID=A0AAE1M9W3_9FABA|nr:hypothetical protein QN277_007366 [Acacia crassicarpa]
MEFDQMICPLNELLVLNRKDRPAHGVVRHDDLHVRELHHRSAPVTPKNCLVHFRLQVTMTREISSTLCLHICKKNCIVGAWIP